MTNLSPLQKARYAYEPKLPEVLKNKISDIIVDLGEPTKSAADQLQLLDLFPLTYGAPIARFAKGNNPDAGKARKIGVILSGGQAPGGHNVIAGIFDALKKANPESILYGFKGGPAGIIDGDFME
ncbi:MAG: diphosphate--fructose-6-phosphate 1-phosphotransferase, partial [Spirochaetaceae bacterium]|nr:diphosphate--fructose-6-phosphate 1-phosphotransferase [Spirochaetaceae bacterium]